MPPLPQRLGIGFSLHSEIEFLELTRTIVEEEADFFEVAPETMWRAENGKLVDNDYRSLFLEIRRRSGKPFVAHGLAFSPGTAIDADRSRTEAWLARLRRDQADFQFPWISEHLGWTTVDGLQGVLPLPLPFDEEAVETVAARMRLLQGVAPLAGFENNVTYFHLGDPEREPDFWNAIGARAGCGMLLDLHNAWTQCRNAGIDPGPWVDRIDLSRVFEIHLSGGSESDPDWVPSKRVFRIDTHDGAVPEGVWELLDRVLPRCTSLRGIVVERLNGTLDEADVPALREELRRARRAWPA